MFCRTTRCPPNCLPRPEGPDPPLPGAGPGPATLSQGTPAPPRVPGGPGAQHLTGPTVETTLKAEILSYFYMMRAVFRYFDLLSMYTLHLMLEGLITPNSPL